MTTLVSDATDVDTRPAPKPPRPLWRNRDFMLLWGGQAVSVLGSQVSQLAFPLLVLVITQSPAQAGLIGALRAVPFALVGLPAGALVDRWDRKRLMIVCDAVRALALGSIPIAVLLGHLTLLQLAIVSLVEGTLSIFFTLAETAALPRVVPKEQLPDATTLNMATESTSLLLGPSLAGLIYGLGALLPFLADAVSYGLSVLSLFFMRVPFQEERARPERTRLWAEVGEGVAWLWRQPLIRALAVLTGGLILSSFGYSLIVIVIAQRQHASTFVIGLLMASGGAGSILGSLAVGPLQKRFTFGQVMIFSTWFWALSWLLYAFAPNPFVLGVANAAGYIIIPIYMGSVYSYRVAMIPDALQGRVNSVFRLIAFGSQPISLAVTGWLLQTIGPVPTVLVTFVPQLGLAVWATLNAHIRTAPSLAAVTAK
jgi:MFS family permease